MILCRRALRCALRGASERRGTSGGGHTATSACTRCMSASSTDWGICERSKSLSMRGSFLPRLKEVLRHPLHHAFGMAWYQMGVHHALLYFFVPKQLGYIA